MPNVGVPEFGCDNDFDLDAIAIEKETSQAQIDGGEVRANTRVVTKPFTRTAVDYFSYTEDTDSFVALETATFAILGFYSGTGWSGGSTGKSSVSVAVNDNPIALDTTVSLATANIPNGLTISLNFPVGQEEAGALREFSVVQGQHVQLFTDRSGNEGGSNESGSDAPDLFEYAQIIFIKRS